MGIPVDDWMLDIFNYEEINEIQEEVTQKIIELREDLRRKARYKNRVPHYRTASMVTHHNVPIKFLRRIPHRFYYPSK